MKYILWGLLGAAIGWIDNLILTMTVFLLLGVLLGFALNSRDKPMNKVLFKLLHPNAQSPKRAKENSAGFDMYAPERVEIHPGQSYWVKSGVSMAIPYGYVGLIHPRSGLAYKHSLTTLGGVIDADYRGEVLIGLHNLGKDVIEIKAGDRVCQMLVHAYMGDSQTVDVLPEDVDRGDAGFNSTGR